MKIDVITVGPLDENCIIVYCEKHRAAIIVDPGDSGKRIIDHIENKQLIPKLILNTHCHADHVGGVGAVVEHFKIPFLCHEDDEFLLTDPGQRELAEYVGLKPPPKNDAPVTDGEVVDLCDDFSIRVIHTPGHTPGGVSLVADGRLISGDTLFQNSIGRSDLPGGNHETLIASIKDKLLVLPDDTVVYPGHGDTTTIGHEKAHNPFLRQTEGYS